MNTTSLLNGGVKIKWACIDQKKHRDISFSNKMKRCVAFEVLNLKSILWFKARWEVEKSSNHTKYHHCCDFIMAHLQTLTFFLSHEDDISEFSAYLNFAIV